MKKAIVVYHKSCDDGFGAAFAAWLAFGDSADYIPMQYGGALDSVLNVGRDLFILDFSFPRPVLLALHERLAEHGAALTVLDHHKSAAEDLAGLPFAHFDLDKSGARLAWEHFHPGRELPPLLAHIEDRDLWRFALPGTKAISAWLRSYPRDFSRWQELAAMLNASRLFVIAEGDAILRADAQKVEATIAGAVLIDLAGHRVPCVNTTTLHSEVGARLCERYPDAPFSVTYFDELRQGRRVWSLRSRGGFDCSVIAKLFGGGGHAGAAGFQTPLPAVDHALIWMPTPTR